ncbi:hypothetical protein [Pseudomonas pharyngis]|uniref:hypothetical protein n=1 Tax=Pseudomonas pharyngis TaxID=2892333 RepID=UPI001F1D5BFD|nr:hypothetical protein [Pseudomonas pharyngis]
MSSSGPLNFNPPQVIGVLDHSLDPEGHIPYELLSEGIDVVVPLWPSYATKPGERDKLIVRFEKNDQAPVEIIKEYLPADIQPEFVIHIGPEYLLNDGVGQLWYEVYDTADHLSCSDPRNLTIDHTPIADELDEADFRDATIWGYVNCDTDPPIWEGIRVDIPPLNNFKIGDRCETLWRGYRSLNGSGVEFVRARWKDVRKSLSAEDIERGYGLTVLPYEPHIKPMDDQCSATIVYRIFRGDRLVGISKLAVLKIDRVISGDGFCGPT